MKVVGWRAWYDDGKVYDSESQAWSTLPDDGLLVKVIYYDDGTKQIQTGDWYFEAPHPYGVVRRTCSDGEKAEMEERYPQAVFVRGYWTVDEWFYQVRDLAMVTTWQ